MKAFYRWLAAVAAAAILLLGLSSTAGAVTTKLKVAFMAGQPPFQFLDGEGRPVGMHIDILEAIAEECDLVLEYLPMETNSECLRALEEGRTDIVLGVMVSDKGYAGRMTSEITSSPLCMVVPNRILNENGELAVFPYKVVFQHGTADNYLVSSLGANQCIIVGSQREVMEAHLQGRAEVMVGVKNSILYQLRERGLMDDYTIHHNYMENVGYAIAVPEGDHSLRYLLNNGIASLRSSRRYETIWDKWIISDSSEKLRLLLRRGAVAGVAVGLAVLGYSVVNARVKKALKRQVEEKTREVTAANLELEKRVIQIENDSDLRNRIIKYAPVGIVLFDRDFRVTLANRSVCCLTGVSGDLTGRNVLDLPVVGKILQPISERVFDRDFSLSNNVITLGKGRQCSSYRCNIHWIMKLEDVDGAMLMVENITQEEQRKQELFAKEKQHTLSQMIAGIAHEIKNPLMSIRTYAQLIESMSGNEEFLQSFAEFVPRETERINSLVEGLINYAKPVKGVVETVSVGELIENCLYLTQTIKLKGAISVRLEVDETLRIQVDKAQIQQVLINIIVNGIESMENKLAALTAPPEDPLPLVITACPREDQAVITVLDSGEGMTPEQLRDCIEPFFTTKESGTGLGLALSKQFVEENGGTLSIESSLGEYTKIEISFRRIEP